MSFPQMYALFEIIVMVFNVNVRITRYTKDT